MASPTPNPARINLLRDRGGQNQQCDHKILRRFRLFATEDEKCETTGKHRKDQHLDVGRVFQVAHEFAARPATPSFSRGQSAFDESPAFHKIEHTLLYLRDAGAGERCCWYAPMI